MKNILEKIKKLENTEIESSEKKLEKLESEKVEESEKEKDSTNKGDSLNETTGNNYEDFKCDECNFNCKRKVGLKIHIKKKTPEYSPIRWK